MTLTTGLLDNFGRTVAAGSWGTADSGQAYTLTGTASDFAVSGGFGTITPSALSSARLALVDMTSFQWNLAVQWKISALPASGTVRAGLVGGYKDGNNLYQAYASVTSAGAVNVVIERIVGGTNTALITGGTISGLTIAANTVYGFRFSGFYDFTARKFTISAKVWPTTAAEPYGANVMAQDGSTYGGSSVGVYAANLGAATGAVFSYDFLNSANHALPYPATTDPMCYDPAVLYPRQTVAQSLASAVDSYMAASIDADAARAANWPRVRISKSNYANSAIFSLSPVSFDTLEFNVGTSTDLTINPQQISLPAGLWLLTAEVIIPASNTITNGTLGFNGEIASVDFRVDAGTGNGNFDTAIGSAIQTTVLAGSSAAFTENVFVNVSGSGGLSFTYLALEAQKIADYFS